MDNWISVKEALPEFGEKVLVCIGNKSISCGDLNNISQSALGTIIQFNTEDKNCPYVNYVTHWMPLPKLPK